MSEHNSRQACVEDPNRECYYHQDREQLWAKLDKIAENTAPMAALAAQVANHHTVLHGTDSNGGLLITFTKQAGRIGIMWKAFIGACGIVGAALVGALLALILQHPKQ